VCYNVVYEFEHRRILLACPSPGMAGNSTNWYQILGRVVLRGSMAQIGWPEMLQISIRAHGFKTEHVWAMYE